MSLFLPSMIIESDYVKFGCTTIAKKKKKLLESKEILMTNNEKNRNNEYQLHLEIDILSRTQLANMSMSNNRNQIKKTIIL